MWAKIRRRLCEPSTYAGLAVLAALFGVKELQALSMPEIAAALAAAAAVVLPEAGSSARASSGG